MRDEQDVGVGLAEAIATVRRELERAIEEGENSALAFRAGQVELEFQVRFSKTGSAGAGVRAWIITAGAKGGSTDSTAHRLKLSLKPLRRADLADQIIGDVATH